MWEHAPREVAQPIWDEHTGRVIALTRDGAVRSVAPGGEVSWAFETGKPFSAAALAHEGRIYVPGGDGLLYALNANDGSLIWKYDAKEALATRPVLADGKVLVASHASTLYAISAEDGAWAWQYARERPTGFTIRGVHRPFSDGERVYAGFPDGRLVALDPATGAVEWEKTLAGRGENRDVDAVIRSDAGQLYAASYQTGVFSLDGDKGDLVWNNVSTGVTGLSLAGQILFTAGDAQLSAVLAETGGAIWRTPFPGRAVGQPTLANGHLLAPVENGLAFVEPKTGELELLWDPGEGVSAPVATGGGKVFVLSNQGYLYALRLHSPG